MGSGPEETGVCQGPFPDANSNSCEWNGVDDSLVPPISGEGALFPSIFQVLADKGLSTSAVYRYQNISKLIAPNNVSQSFVPTDMEVVNTVISQLQQSNPPTYILAQLMNLLSIGETHGYDSPEYIVEISKEDILIGEIVSSKFDNFVQYFNLYSFNQCVLK